MCLGDGKMGTNFYFGKDEGVHIGKRSAAGLFCWDCVVSLCNHSVDTLRGKDLYGSDAIHYSNKEPWLEVCPICGNAPLEETLDNSASGRELGFNKNRPSAKNNVTSCCSFSWALSPKDFCDLFIAGEMQIFDEYGREYTRNEFRDVLSECPIKYYHIVGIEFC